MYIISAYIYTFFFCYEMKEKIDNVKITRYMFLLINKKRNLLYAK